MADHQMTEREIERLAELISIKTSEKYLMISKESIKQAIEVHVANCQAGKFQKITALFSAVVGGIFVAIASWLLRKL